MASSSRACITSFIWKGGGGAGKGEQQRRGGAGKEVKGRGREGAGWDKEDGGVGEEGNLTKYITFPISPKPPPPPHCYAACMHIKT